MLQMVFNVCWNPKGVGPNASEGMDLLARHEQASKEQKLSSFMSLYGLPTEGMAQIRRGSSRLKTSRLKLLCMWQSSRLEVDLLTSN